MALSEIAQHKIFEILEIPNAETSAFVDRGYHLIRGELLQRIAAHNTAATAGDPMALAQEERVLQIIEQWDCVALYESGTKPLPTNGGVRYSPARDRKRLQRMLRYIFPVRTLGLDGLPVANTSSGSSLKLG